MIRRHRHRHRHCHHHRHHHHHSAVIVSRGWAKASPCCFIKNMIVVGSCYFLSTHQCLSIIISPKC